ncbi:hypothetical protein VDIAB_100598 [Vibrio diabolicus]|nr:hypothetical protein VDIAB_100598 [Vibrio diabolicus]
MLNLFTPDSPRLVTTDIHIRARCLRCAMINADMTNSSDQLLICTSITAYILELGFQKVPVTAQGGLHETTMDMGLTFTFVC